MVGNQCHRIQSMSVPEAADGSPPLAMVLVDLVLSSSESAMPKGESMVKLPPSQLKNAGDNSAQDFSLPGAEAAQRLKAAIISGSTVG